MTQQAKLTFLAIAASVVIIVGGFYLAQLRSQLAEVRQQSSAAQQELQKLNATLGQTQSSLAAASESQRQLESQLAQSKTRIEDLSATLGQQVGALKTQVSELQAEMTYRNKVSTWWRDLFDYTKPFKGAAAEGAAR